MNIIRTVSDMKSYRLSLREKGVSVGLVPTMGALHDGHLSLIRHIRSLCDIVITSIFVNPIQFGRNEDLGKYPRPFDEDCQKAGLAGCNVVFSPEPADMYPKDFSTYIEVEKITAGLCGASRPGHFRGVATVVLKFFNIISPDMAIFGQKDAQQVAVIRRMVEDLDCPVKIITAPIVREKDGLALSSRNSYLTPDERSEVPAVFAGLGKASSLFMKGEKNASRLKAAVLDSYSNARTFTVEYVEIVDIKTLEPLSGECNSAMIAVAVRTSDSKTRLIDNIVLGGDF
jgi:pantoate--beta-alanine ligase